MDLDFRPLIPHRAPMVLIDAVTQYGPAEIRAVRAVRVGDPFVTQHGLEDAALLEVIAQTIAAGDALYARSKQGRVIRGYLTGLTGVQVLGRAQCGQTIKFTRCALKRMDGMGLFDVQAAADGAVIASGRFKLYVDIDYSRER